MKRLLSILFAVLLLTGCGNTEVPATTVAPTETQAPTEPPVPWVQELGEPWDVEGALVELPLDVPNGLIYSSHMVFDGDLLLWSQDNHRLDAPKQELCVVDLDTGEVFAQKDIPISVTTMPQVLGDSLYLVDNQSGCILKLDKSLAVVQAWQTDIRDAAVYLDGNGYAYVSQWGAESWKLNLETGETWPILEEDPEIAYLDCYDNYLCVTYYHPDSGEDCIAYLNLSTGERYDAPIQGTTGCEFRDGIWLLHEYDESFSYTLFTPGAEAVEVDMGYNSLRLVGNDQILKISDASNRISLHDLSGKALSQCTISEQGYGYENYEVIYSENLGGYFVLVSNYGGSIRLLFWDTTKGERGEDIPFVPIPEPSELEVMIQQRIAALEAEYGVQILVGEEAVDYFYDFEAEAVTDLYDIDDALDTLEDALEDYPEGFFHQLRYGEVRRTEIRLAGTLTATNSEYTDTYEAFVQDGYDCHVMVVDIYLCDEATYYHEFSHIIDSYLEWDAMNREGALFSDETWCSLNPNWFPGYTYSYSWEQYVEDYSCFVDSYSTINPTEDRARVLEYAMVDYGQWTFEDAQVLQNKLDYYCRCIRDAFDTTGWPDTVLWEQYLP